MRVNVGDTVVFNPFAVDDPEYWDDYGNWKKELVCVEKIETDGHPFLHVFVRSIGNPSFADWVDMDWLFPADEQEHI